MTATLDLADIQGHVLRAYARFGYPTGRYVFLNVTEAAAARRFLTEILPHLTTAVCWGEGKNEMAPPDLAVNLAFLRGELDQFGQARAVEFPESGVGIDILGDPAGVEPRLEADVVQHFPIDDGEMADRQRDQDDKGHDSRGASDDPTDTVGMHGRLA